MTNEDLLMESVTSKPQLYWVTLTLWSDYGGKNRMIDYYTHTEIPFICSS